MIKKSNLRVYPFFQFIFELKLKNRYEGIWNRLKAGVANRIFDTILRYGDPLVGHSIAGADLLLHMSHKLPFYLKSYPLHSLNIPRIAKLVKQKYPNFTFIDIGANIGDTVAFLRNQAVFPILCIEGDNKYFPVLEYNLSQFTDVDSLELYISDKTEDTRGEAKRKEGTAYLSGDTNSCGMVQVKRLSDALKHRPGFEKSKMLKIDTDGFDCKILRGAVDFLEIAKPVIFFEYEPLTLRRQGDDGISVFDVLKKSGYKRLLFYDDIGYLMLSCEIDNKMLIEQINQYLSGKSRGHYCDVCVFHEEDSDLFEKVLYSEMAFYRGKIG